MLRLGLNLYGPCLGAGVKVERVSADWLELDVRMRLRWYNRNAMGVHFGGSLYAMVDPHFVLVLMQKLGREYASANSRWLPSGRRRRMAALAGRNLRLLSPMKRARWSPGYIRRFMSVAKSP
ncbi:hypothetical protein EDC39_11630 [Geothermobacter ehrlichii]|uniref:Uncharacterized protein n=1 Tax=Geothermobacter ehrlichii TaxID=213224 RepID=A0A5D3WGJ7_9BACT|nr:DUF4442 domain-containing protein [Geothermobacter ehrlichii]TYO95823.1 hypothetical protein EDC39_11630 [Geothermobacter ehrlichii]